MRRFLRVAAVLGLVLGPVTLLAADETPAKEPPPKAPDWSGYVFVADVVGEVVKADDKKVVLRITWFAPQVQGGNKNANNNKYARPKLSGNHRNFRNPFAANMNRPNQPKVQFKEHHHDYELEYLPESLVRLKSLPSRTDANGKPQPYTNKEIDEARQPSGVPGYAGNKFDVVPGTFLEVHLIRDKTIQAAKATEDDLRIKYAVVMGKDPNPPKDIANSDKKKDDKKKKN